jgi:hypothetical protein
MRIAYDTFLQSEVSADLAAKAGSFEPYRYECAHCGEEVSIAAVGSIRMIPHFRHHSGNSNIECDLYIGQYGAISTDARSRKSKNERAEFYFDSNTKMFHLGLRFSEDEISAYEKQSTIFELRATTNTEPFFSLRINGRNFVADVQCMIPINKFSHNYFLSNTLNGIKRKYEVFNNSGNNTPTFFKLQISDSDYRAKLVRSSVLYTNIPYFVAYQSQYWSPMDERLPNEIKVENTFKFETMGRNFLGKVLSIKSKTAQIDSLLMSWGYQLEASETLTLLWPPSMFFGDSALIDADSAYLYSTFDLHAHGNINVHSKDIKKIADGISKVSVNSRTKVYKKNVELVLDKHEQISNEYDVISMSRKESKAYVVSDDGTYLFNRSGVSPLSKGMSVLLTPKSEIRHYSFGYLDGYVIPLKHSALTSDRLIQDILIQYKRMENFKWDDFDSLKLSHTAFQYIETCKISGQINSAVKHFIKEGRL